MTVPLPWEYRRETTSPPNVTAMLALCGKDGWELVHVREIEEPRWATVDGQKPIEMIFKRQSPST